MAKLDQVRWRCRRGLLELDLILRRFNDQHLGELAPDELAYFTELLALPDPDLLDLVMGRSMPAESRYPHMLDLLRHA
jgi:antitoxin CptB